jgi:hypothetical protein
MQYYKSFIALEKSVTLKDIYCSLRNGYDPQWT